MSHLATFANGDWMLCYCSIGADHNAEALVPRIGSDVPITEQVLVDYIAETQKPVSSQGTPRLT